MAGLSSLINMYNTYTKASEKAMKVSRMLTEDFLGISRAAGSAEESTSGANDEITKAAAKMKELHGIAVKLGQAMKSGMDFTDQYVQTNNILRQSTTSLEDHLDLQKKIHASANRSRNAYQDVANTVAQMGLHAKDMFTNTDEMVGFTELAQKAFKMGGADTGAQNSGMEKVIQAMSSGEMSGSDFSEITDGAPLILEAITRYTNLSEEKILELGEAGAISASVLKESLFAMSSDINSQFNSMPKKFSEIWERMKNGALMAFAPVMDQIAEIISSDRFQGFIDGVINGFFILGTIINEVLNLITFLWPLIEPFLIALAIVFLPIIISSIWGAVQAAWALIPPIIAAIAPFLPLIAVLGMFIFFMQQAGVTVEDVFGFIGGIIGIIFIQLYNHVATLINIWLTFLNFFENFTKDPVAAVKALFLDLAVNVLGFIEKMAQGIQDLLNKIPGVNVDIVGKITALKENIAKASKDVKDAAGFEDKYQMLEMKDYSEGFLKGQEMGKDVSNGIGDYFGGFAKDANQELPWESFGGGDASMGTGSNPAVVQGAGKNNAVDVNISDDNLKYMRELAERNYINKISQSTLAPNISVQVDANNMDDLDKIGSRIAYILQNEIAVASEGAY